MNVHCTMNNMDIKNVKVCIFQIRIGTVNDLRFVLKSTAITVAPISMYLGPLVK